MKTLIITLEYPPQIGGIASYAYNLAKHLPAEETFVWSPTMTGDVDFDAKNPWKTFRGKPYYVFFWPRWLRWYRQIKKIVKQEKIERLLIQHALPGGYIGYMINKLLKVPYRVFFHGSDLEIGLKKKLKKLTLVCAKAEKIIVSSEFLKTKILSRCENIAPVIVVHPAPGDHFLTPIKPEEVASVRRSLALDGKNVIISVGRIAEGKGFPHLMRLLPKIVKRVPNAVLLLIGDGPKRKALLESIQANGLQNCVRYLGFIPNEELPKYYQAADLFALLTHRDEKSEEGWGTVYMEAAACGLPIVAGNVGGVEEAVKHLQTGILVDTYQELEVIGAVCDLLLKDDYARAMGSAGRERVLNEFAWDKQVQKIME
ncbi:MAG: glycosyltransferase family 4 protein [Patescibacteria group bacterium]